MKRLVSRWGFTILETVIAITIMAVAIGAVVALFQGNMKLRARDRGTYALGQVEQGIRREVHNRLRTFFTGGCVGNFLNIWAAPTPGGLVFTPLFSTGAVNAIREPAGTRDIGADRFNAALNRCAGSWLSALPGNYFNTRREIYFCLRVQAAPNWPGGHNDPITTMQPVIAEFYYTNINVINPGTVRLTCNQVNGTNPSLGNLAYAIYWRPRDQQTTFHQVVMGYLSLGN